jgi:hypothetical protein
MKHPVDLILINCSRCKHDDLQAIKTCPEKECVYHKLRIRKTFRQRNQALAKPGERR